MLVGTRHAFGNAKSVKLQSTLELTLATTFTPAWQRTIDQSKNKWTNWSFQLAIERTVASCRPMMAIEIFGTEPTSGPAVHANTNRGHAGKDGISQPSVRPSVLDLPQRKRISCFKHFLECYNIQYVNEIPKMKILHHI